MSKLLCSIALLIAVAAAPAFADTPPPITGDTAAQLAPMRDAVGVFDDAVHAGIITRAQADQGDALQLKRAAAFAGREVNRAELMSIEVPANGAPPEQHLTALQRAAGAVTFVNILWVLAIGVGALCFAFLFGSYVIDLLKLFKHIPLVVYEGVFYLSGLGLGAYGLTLGAGTADYVGLTGCLLFGGALVFSAKHHEAVAKKFNFSLICFIAWTGAALAYQSSMLGFIAVIALLGVLGFSVMATPLCYAIGFKDDAAVGKATSAAFGLLAVFAGVRIAGAHLPAVQIFERGALFMGSFVGYLGLLVASSKWYGGKQRNYALFQAVTILAGIGAIYVGSVFGISELQKIGGTFFVLYGLEKIFEIPAKSARGYAFIGLIAAAAIYAFCLYVKANPDSIRPFLFM